MDFSSQILADFAVILIVGAAVTFIFHKLKQPLIIGYLVAGIIIGPYTPPFAFVQEFEAIEAAAGLGVVLLLFSIGLEFPLKKLLKLGIRNYIIISFFEITLMFAISFLTGWLFSWPWLDSLFLGMALASSSTVVIAKVLQDLGKIKDISATVMMGVLIAEDLIVVLMLAVATTILGVESADFSDIMLTTGKMILFVIVAVVAGSFIIPKVIDYIAKPEREDNHVHDEVLAIASVGICFGLAIIGGFFGLSVAIGAFLVGILVAAAKSAEKVAHVTAPIKDLFAAIFFVSMGTLIDITQFQDFWVPVIIVTAVMLLGKVLGCGFGSRVCGYDRNTSLKVGLGMGQIGEFALIVVKAGQDLNVISPFIFPTIGIAVGITAFLTPYLIRASYRIPEGSWRLNKKKGTS